MLASRSTPFRLFLARHANAGWPGPGANDFDRSLDRKGQAEIRDVAVRLYAQGYLPEKIVSSPARRCHQTTLAILDVFGAIDTEFDSSLYDEGVDAYRRQIELNADKNSLMLVGHNPMIEALANQLCDQPPAEVALGYPTAGLLVLDFDRPLDRLLSGGKAIEMLAPL